MSLVAATCLPVSPTPFQSLKCNDWGGDGVFQCGGGRNAGGGSLHPWGRSGEQQGASQEGPWRPIPHLTIHAQ